MLCINVNLASGASGSSKLVTMWNLIERGWEEGRNGGQTCSSGGLSSPNNRVSEVVIYIFGHHTLLLSSEPLIRKSAQSRGF